MTVLVPVEVINVGDGLLHHLHLKEDNAINHVTGNSKPLKKINIKHN
jgi:hypothetical protein